MTFISMAEVSRIIRASDSFQEGYFVILDSQGKLIWEEGEALCTPEQMIHYGSRQIEGTDIFIRAKKNFYYPIAWVLKRAGNIIVWSDILQSQETW